MRYEVRAAHDPAVLIGWIEGPEHARSLQFRLPIDGTDDGISVAVRERRLLISTIVEPGREPIRAVKARVIDSLHELPGFTPAP